jgi:hypothetical protein
LSDGLLFTINQQAEIALPTSIDPSNKHSSI